MAVSTRLQLQSMSSVFVPLANGVEAAWRISQGVGAPNLMIYARYPYDVDCFNDVASLNVGGSEFSLVQQIITSGGGWNSLAPNSPFTWAQLAAGESWTNPDTGYTSVGEYACSGCFDWWLSNHTVLEDEQATKNAWCKQALGKWVQACLDGVFLNMVIPPAPPPAVPEDVAFQPQSHAVGMAIALVLAEGMLMVGARDPANGNRPLNGYLEPPAA